MPIAEIAGAINSVRSSLEIAKAMVSLRDAEAFRIKSLELRESISDALEKSIAARMAQSDQLDRINALEAELANLKAWDAEQEDYELVALNRGASAFMLKPHARSTKPPHWLCPNCFANRKKSFLLPTANKSAVETSFVCTPCGSAVFLRYKTIPEWKE